MLLSTEIVQCYNEVYIQHIKKNIVDIFEIIKIFFNLVYSDKQKLYTDIIPKVEELEYFVNCIHFHSLSMKIVNEINHMITYDIGVLENILYQHFPSSNNYSIIKELNKKLSILRI